MSSLTDYSAWQATRANITLDCGCQIQIPVVAGVDAQAVIDTITITSYFVHEKLACVAQEGRME